MPEEKLRTPRDEDDQPLPTPNNLPAIQDLVIADMQARKQLGIKRYGTVLQANNGRDFLLDAYQEALDLAMYLRGEIEQRRLLTVAAGTLGELLSTPESVMENYRSGEITTSEAVDQMREHLGEKENE